MPGRRRDSSGEVWSVMLRIGLAGLALAAGMLAAAAQEMKSPRITPAHADWEAVAADLGAVEPGKPAAAPELMAKLNHATGERFPNIAASPVPVLLPFDTPTFLRDRAGAPEPADASANTPADPYLFGFNAVPFFYSGPSGYDAVVLAHAQELREPGMRFADTIYIHIGGSALLYQLDEPVGMIGWPVHDLDEIPGIRRLYLENYVRYTFVRYGVPYVVAIECSDGAVRFRKISCRDADKVAIRFLKSLRVAGGTPQAQPEAITADTIERPAGQSSVFTYRSPGDILPGTGFRRKGGVADYTVYSKIRFPLADAPAFANSQSFMNWGDCDATGRAGAGFLDGVRTYRCRVNGRRLVLDESAGDNYSYPWRDNFCEHRYFYVGQCPAGLGHQGQDIRPAFCKQRIQGANRCEPYLHDVVAVRDGAVLRAPTQEALYLVVNAPNERIRFRYLHMFPRQFNAAGLVSGRLVHEGEVIGKVGNFFRRERATTYHLHFDMQVPTKYGWVFVNPYMTLVTAYERLIRGRGQEIKDEDAHEDLLTAAVPDEPLPATAPAAAPISAAKPTETAIKSPGAPVTDFRIRGHEGTDEPSPVKASLPLRLGGSHGGVGRNGARTGKQNAVRAVGRSVPRTGSRAWYIRRHIHAGYDYYQTRYGSF
jgi:hypothetical protein